MNSKIVLFAAALSVVLSGTAFGDTYYFRNKGLMTGTVSEPPPPVIPGNQNFAVGASEFIVPNYNTLTITLAGPGGGGGGAPTTNSTTGAEAGSPGPATQISELNLTAHSGGGGGAAAIPNGSRGTAGSQGVAVGGDTNETGGGAVGGIGGHMVSPNNNYGGDGGNGGRLQKTISVSDPGAPAPGTTLTVVVGDGGLGGSASGWGDPGRPGRPGSASIFWQ